MSDRKKRIYNSENRDAQAAATRGRILDAARELFQSEGFECVTIEKLAQKAQVSMPTIYALFQSKLGILRSLIDQALPVNQFETLVLRAKEETSATNRLAITAKIARQIYDAEHEQMAVFRGASVLAPELKQLEMERELRRYQRLEDGVQWLAKEKSLIKGLSLSKAHDICWAFTGRDIYRMLVVERGWKSDEYEKWLGQSLVKMLIGANDQ